MPLRFITMQIRDAVVLITGASEGIGKACAMLLRQRGAKVSLSGLETPEFQSGEIDGTLITTGDITDPSARQELVSRTINRFSRIDVLINNAGVGLYATPSEVPTDLSKRLFDINVFAAASLAQETIPHMKRLGRGMIIHMGSVGGYVSLPWAVMYCASKFALHAYSDSLRRELNGTGIHVMKVCPGIVNTDFRKHVLGGTAPRRIADIKRVVSPQEVAKSVLWGIEHNARVVYVPKIGKLFTVLEYLSPALMDWYLSRKW